VPVEKNGEAMKQAIRHGVPEPTFAPDDAADKGTSGGSQKSIEFQKSRGQRRESHLAIARSKRWQKSQ
jgi:hypothetical protein